MLQALPLFPSSPTTSSIRMDRFSQQSWVCGAVTTAQLRNKDTQAQPPNSKIISKKQLHCPTGSSMESLCREGGVLENLYPEGRAALHCWYAHNTTLALLGGATGQGATAMNQTLRISLSTQPRASVHGGWQRPGTAAQAGRHSKHSWTCSCVTSPAAPALGWMISTSPFPTLKI